MNSWNPIVGSKWLICTVCPGLAFCGQMRGGKASLSHKDWLFTVGKKGKKKGKLQRRFSDLPSLHYSVQMRKKPLCETVMKNFNERRGSKNFQKSLHTITLPLSLGVSQTLLPHKRESTRQGGKTTRVLGGKTSTERL